MITDPRQTDHGYRIAEAGKTELWETEIGEGPRPFRREFTLRVDGTKVLGTDDGGLARQAFVQIITAGWRAST